MARRSKGRGIHSNFPYMFCWLVLFFHIVLGRSSSLSAVDLTMLAGMMDIPGRPSMGKGSWGSSCTTGWQPNVYSVVYGQHPMDAFQGRTDVRQEGDRGLILPEPSVLFRWMERRWRICLCSYPFFLRVVFRNTNSTRTACPGRWRHCASSLTIYRSSRCNVPEYWIFKLVLFISARLKCNLGNSGSMWTLCVHVT